MEAKKFSNLWVPITRPGPLPLLDFLKTRADFSGHELKAHPAIIVDDLMFSPPGEKDYIGFSVSVPFVMTREGNFSVLVPHIGVVERQKRKVLLGGEYRITDPEYPTLSVVAIMLDNEGNVKPYPLAGLTLSGFVYTK